MNARVRMGRTGGLAVALLLAAALLGGCTLAGTDGGGSAPTDRQGLSQTPPLGAPGTENPEDLSSSSELRPEEQLASKDSPAAAPTAGADRLVIRTKSMRVQVDDVPKTVATIRDLAGRHGGSVSALQISTDDSGPVYRYDEQGAPATGYDGAPLAGFVTVRVPVARFDAFAADAAKIGKVLRQSEGSDDVTQEHVDLEARLKNLRAEEARLRQFFSAAKNVNDMLKIEGELSRVRGEIEAMQAQVDHLERQAAMSTVTLELVEPKPVVRPAGENWGFVAAVTQSLRAFMGTVNGMIVVFGAVLPIMILLLIAAFVARWIWRRLARRHGEAPDSEPAPADSPNV